MPQFNSRVYRNFCSKLKIKNLYSTPQYPQSNNQAEASNKTLLSSLKKRLHSTKRKWVDELPGVLAAYRITSWKPTEVSPFTLTYGMEAIIPIEIEMPIVRVEILKEANAKAIAKDLNTTNKFREATIMRIASYQHRLENLQTRRVKPHTVLPRELVLRRVFENMTNPVDGKFQPNWEGPYMVVRVRTTRSYALSRLDGTAIPRMWNAMHLKKYYK